MAAAESKYDVCIVGAGILGTCIAFWLSDLYDCSVAVVDRESSVAAHTSSRNTGIVHRPFYMNPEKKKKFARAAQTSYHLWSKLAKQHNLPWRQRGVIEVATDEKSIAMLGDYHKWALANGMGEDEVELLDSRQVKQVEPLVECPGAIFSKTDACVDYGKFTNCVFSLARQNGVVFISGVKVAGAREMDEVQLELEGGRAVGCRLLVNCAGGGSVRLAHAMGIGREYADLHFRGDYWRVGGLFASRISHNIYSVPRHSEYPFLDPHFILRVDGRAEIGPNAALVAGPYVYEGFTGGASQFFSKLFERPMSPRMSLAFNAEFLSLAWDEWKGSISKKAMCDRVRRFIPSLAYDALSEKGIAGVRSALLDGKGFVPEAIELWTDSSLHILNYNSPGATGSPAYSAQLVEAMREKGFMDGFRLRASQTHISSLSFEEATRRES